MNLNGTTSSILNYISTSRLCLMAQSDLPAVHVTCKTTSKSKSDPTLYPVLAGLPNNEDPGPSKSSQNQDRAVSLKKDVKDAKTRTAQDIILPKPSTIPEKNEDKKTFLANQNIKLMMTNLNQTRIAADEAISIKSVPKNSSKSPKIERSSSEYTIIQPYVPTWSSISLREHSSSSMGVGICRICMVSGPERLISPCHCKGSLGLVHVTCLERWLSMAGRCRCELCGFRFSVVQTQRYPLCRALTMWFNHSRNRATFQTDCLFFSMLSILTTAMVVCCIMGSRYFMDQGGVLGLSRALAEGLTDALMVTVVCGYAVTAYALWSDHATIWRRWRNATMDVRLVLEDQRPNQNQNAN